MNRVLVEICLCITRGASVAPLVARPRDSRRLAAHYPSAARGTLFFRKTPLNLLFECLRLLFSFDGRINVRDAGLG